MITTALHPSILHMIAEEPGAYMKGDSRIRFFKRIDSLTLFSIHRRGDLQMNTGKWPFI